MGVNMLTFAEQLTVAESDRDRELKEREDVFRRNMRGIVRNHAEFHALRDFDEYWLPSIRKAYESGYTSVDSRGRNMQHDEWYGWALHKLLTEKLGPRFGVTELIPSWYTFRKPYVRVTWKIEQA